FRRRMSSPCRTRRRSAFPTLPRLISPPISLQRRCHRPLRTQARAASAARLCRPCRRRRRKPRNRGNPPCSQRSQACSRMQPGADGGAPGLLDDSNAGLGANIWQGSSGAQLITLIPKLPAPQTQPSLRDLQLRLLLTKAPGPNAGNGIDPLVPLRAERLHAMGFSTEAMLLTKGAANAGSGDPRAGFEKALDATDANTACAKVEEAASSQQVLDLYWRKALLFCQITREQDEQASLGLDLIRESAGKDPGTKDFISVASVLLGESKGKKLKLSGAP